MTMFDSIIAETGERFGLGEKAGTLLSALLALLTDENRGGLAEFTGKFNQANFGDASLPSRTGAGAELSNEQLETALGKPALDGIANRIGTDYNQTVSAAAFMTPRIINALAPGGVVPPDSDLRAAIGGYLTDAPAAATRAETFDRVGSAAPVSDEEKKNVIEANAFDKVSPSIDAGIDYSPADIGDAPGDVNNSPLGWLLPLLLLGLLLILGYLFCSKPPAPPAAMNINVNVIQAV